MKNKSKTEKKNRLFIGNITTNKKRCSFSIENMQNKLIRQSKIFNMYYEININRNISNKNNIENILEEKSIKSLSVENEKDIKENNIKENIEGLFGRKSLLTTDDVQVKEKRSSKSDKALFNFF